MSAALELAKDLIARRSITSEDAGIADIEPLTRIYEATFRKLLT